MCLIVLNQMVQHHRLQFANTYSYGCRGSQLRSQLRYCNGLVKQGENFAILTEIQGMECSRRYDFKVAGTKYGVTAIQMDIKVDGLSREILSRLYKSLKGRLFI
jgi:hypothetical protein